MQQVCREAFISLVQFYRFQFVENVLAYDPKIIVGEPRTPGFVVAADTGQLEQINRIHFVWFRIVRSLISPIVLFGNGRKLVGQRRVYLSETWCHTEMPSLLPQHTGR